MVRSRRNTRTRLGWEICNAAVAYVESKADAYPISYSEVIGCGEETTSNGVVNKLRCSSHACEETCCKGGQRRMCDFSLQGAWCLYLTRKALIFGDLDGR